MIRCWLLHRPLHARFRAMAANAHTDDQNRGEQRALLYSLLGTLPSLDEPIRAEKLGEEKRENYAVENLILHLNDREAVPAIFTRPLQDSHVDAGITKPPNSGGRFAAVLYNHFHGNNYKLGKRELLEGGNALQKPAYAEELARRGIAALCIDQWNFGERHTRTESSLFKELLWQGDVLWGMMVYDNLRAFRYLISRDDVDSTRIATLGLSMGSTMAWWCAALEERIKVTIDLCCMTDFDELIATDGLDHHGIYYYVPKLRNHFSTAKINALITPRPHLSLNGNEDPLTPPGGLEKIDDALKSTYERAGARGAWRMYRADHGHFETVQMRTLVLEWLERWL